jgi:hypothetical protein
LVALNQYDLRISSSYRERSKRLESQWPSEAIAAELWSRMLREREIRRIGRLGGDRRPHTEDIGISRCEIEDARDVGHRS